MRLKHWNRIIELCGRTISDIRDDIGQVHLWMDRVMNSPRSYDVTQVQLDYEEASLEKELEVIEQKREYAALRYNHAKNDGMERAIAFEKEQGFPR